MVIVDLMAEVVALVRLWMHVEDLQAIVFLAGSLVFLGGGSDKQACGRRL